MKKNIVIAMGGPSAEYEVSLKTGWEMFKNIDKEKYSVRAVIIDSNKNFYYSEYDPQDVPQDGFKNPELLPCLKGPVNPASSLEIWQNCDLVLMGLHGEFGEDGVFQGFLETIGIPYTGSKVTGSSIGMDKISSKEIFEQNGITTPPYSVFYRGEGEERINEIAKSRSFPCFVKCPQSGSSRLMGRATNELELASFIKEFLKFSNRILIESAISGDEYSCPVLEYPNGTLKALPPILIKPATSFFDFEAKYSGFACEEIVPAPCSVELTEKMQKLALESHKSIGCFGISRTDMIANDRGVFVLEINTLPGFTMQSLLPKSFKSLGGTFSELIDIIINTEFCRNK